MSQLMPEPPDATQLDSASWKELERIVQRFEEAWGAGRRPDLDAHLPAPGQLRRAVLVELVHADLECRLRGGDPARVEEYVGRYPELTQDAAVLQGLLEAEQRLRRAREPGLAASEFGQRLAALLDPQHRPAAHDSAKGSADAATPPVAAASYTATPPGYDILQELGRGGMGVVYRARQHRPRRAVALKVLLSGIYATAQQQARFRAEADALAKLQHANIVRIYEVGAHTGLLFFSMEFVAGGTLAEHLRKEVLAPRAAAELMLALARAVHAAHAQGIIHRDLKPGNILLDADGNPKITDFGLAKNLEAHDAQTRSGEPLGTPAYMAPEQVRGRLRDIGPATDVYALGAILYTLLVGHPPFRGALLQETFDQILGAEPVPPRRLSFRIPKDLETICLKCLHKDPARRYGAAALLADDLERFLTNHPIQARPVGWLERSGKWARRHPARATLAGAALLVLVAAIAVPIGFTRSLATALEQKTAALKVIQDQKDEEERKAQERIRHNLYLSDMRLAFQHWDTGDWQAARTLLQRQLLEQDSITDQRGFEWSMLSRASSLAPRVLELPGAGRSLAFSPDGALLAGGGRFDRVLLWQTKTGNLEAPLPAGSSEGSSVAFAPGGTHLACADEGGRIELWELAGPGRTPRRTQRWEGGSGPLRRVAFSSRGVLAAGDQNVKLWNWRTLQEVAALPVNLRLSAFAFSPDGARLATTSSDGRWQLWDVATGRPQPPIDHPVALTSVAFSTDGRILFTGDQTGAVIAWDAQQGRRLFPLTGHQGPVRALAAAPDGQLLASGGEDGTVRVWDLARLRIRVVLRSHGKEVAAVAFSPDGKHLASTGGDEAVHLWEVERLQAWETLQAPIPAVQTAAFAPDGQTLALACQDHSVRLIDLKTLHEQRRLAGNHLPIHDLVTTGAGKPLALLREDGVPRLADPQDGKLLDLLPAATVVAVSPVRHVVSADRAGEVRLWSWQGDQLEQESKKTARGGTGEIGCVAATADGRFFAAAAGKAVSCWAVDSNQQLELPHQQAVHELAFTHAGQRLVVATATELLLWDVSQRKLLGKFEGFTANIQSLAVSADDRYLAGIEKPGTFYLWDVATRRLERRAEGVRRIVFAPAGKRMAQVRSDGRVFVYDLANWRVRLIEGQQPGPVHSLAFAADGARLYTGSRHEPTVMRTFTSNPAVLRAIFKQLKDDGNYHHVVFGSTAGAVQTWDLGARRPLEALPTPDWIAMHGLAGAADGSLLAAVGAGGWIRCWKGPTLDEQPLFFTSDNVRDYWNQYDHLRKNFPFVTDFATPSYQAIVRAVAVAPRGDVVATVRWQLHEVNKQRLDWRHTVQLWTAAGEPLASLAGSEGLWDVEQDWPVLAFSPDGGLLAFNSKDRIRLVDVAARTPRADDLRTSGLVRSLAFARNGKHLAIGGQDRTIALWDLVDRKLVKSWSAHGDAVTALAFAADGRTLASGSLDASVKLWSAPGGDLLGTLPGPTGKVHAIAFSPAGDVLVSGGETPHGFGEILAWRAD